MFSVYGNAPTKVGGAVRQAPRFETRGEQAVVSDLRSIRVLVFLGLAGFATACTVGARNDPSSTAASNTSPIAVGSAPPTPPAPAAPPPSSCPKDMVLVEGDYCPKPEQQCLRWLDPPGPYHEYRCAEYKNPARCSVPREKKKFCIDREEYVKAGETLPLANQSWTTAGEVCKERGARLCLESEWQFACEGPDMHPYPYGDGFVRDATACNIDRMDLGKPNSGLRDLRAPITEYPKCVSPFGVHNMSGNIEEWSTLDKGVAPDRSSMKGAWWLPGKNTCRAATLGHGEVYNGKQVGVRCCKDPS